MFLETGEPLSFKPSFRGITPKIIPNDLESACRLEQIREMGPLAIIYIGLHKTSSNNPLKG
jgi:hypothetical protein